MRRTVTLVGLLVFAISAPVLSQEQKSSFWDVPKSEPSKAAAAATKGAAPPANTAKGAATKTPEKPAGEKPKSFWDTPREQAAWTGWNSSGAPAAPRSEPAAESIKASPETKRTEAPPKAAADRLSAPKTVASVAKPAVKPVAGRAKSSGAAVAWAGPAQVKTVSGVRLTFPEFLEAPVAMTTVASADAVVPEPAEAPAPEPAPAASPEPQVKPITPPSQPSAPRLPGAAPAPSAATPWLKMSFQYRGRAEDWNTGFAVSDSYYLNRLRMQAEVTPTKWFRAVVQLQDARSVDYSLALVPTNMYNQFDVRLGFVDIKHKQSGTTVRAGRQEFNFGEGRLVSAGDWSNVGRSWDGASVQWQRKQGLMTVFASSVVVVDSKGVDELKHGEQFYGGLYTWTGAKSKRVFEPYVFVKQQDRAIDERGNVGDALITTVGMRAVGPFNKRFDYNMETAYQTGHYAQDSHEAWAVHFGAGTTFGGSWRPRVGIDYDAASGDGEAKDGRRQTFDVLFGTNHAKFGLIDNIAWRNMEHVGVVFTASPVKEIKLTSGWHRNWIRDTRDGYYIGSGSKVKTKATNQNLFGDTIDLQVAVDLTKHISVLFGTGYMFAGPYQVQGVGRDNAFHQFVMWKVVF